MSKATYHQQREAAPPPPAGCPMHESWSPLSPEYLRDPYSVADKLRRETPVFYSQALGYVVVTRMEDIEAIFSDSDTYASVNVQDPVFPLCEAAAEILAADDYDPVAVMSNLPQPDHTRIRVFTRSGFLNNRLKLLEPFIRERSHKLIDNMLAKGAPAEYVEALAFPLPGETIFRFIGFPETDDEMLKGWCGDRKAFTWGKPTPSEQVEIATQMLAYWRYCREFTASKRNQRGDDFASELLNAHDADNEALSYREVESIIYGLSFAGHEAVTNLLCNSLLCVLPRRDQWAQLCADASLIPNAVEEILRFESSQISWRRVTTKPTTLDGIELPTGTAIFLNFASANRQPDRFDDPNTFDIHRQGAHKHISFGKGIHFCLGARMAREEARIVLEVLAERIPSLTMVAGQDLTTFPNITFRGPERLELTWDE